MNNPLTADQKAAIKRVFCALEKVLEKPAHERPEFTVDNIKNLIKDCDKDDLAIALSHEYYMITMANRDIENIFSKGVKLSSQEDLSDYE